MLETRPRATPQGPIDPLRLTYETGSRHSRIDLHLHSRASGAATNWWVKRLGLGFETRESYTEPTAAYEMVKAAGMDFATLTDHETIDGALELLDRPDFLVGEEVNARFPEDGSSVDVLVYSVTPAHHHGLQARRGDVYALVDFVREAGLVAVLAHPVFETGVRLDKPMIEKRLLLFGLWEVINGSRPASQNALAARIAAGIDASTLRQLAAIHGFPVPPHRRIAGTGGSDDHGGMDGGATHTVVPKVETVGELLEALAAGEAWPAGEDGHADKMAHTGFKIAGLAFRENGPPRATEGPESKLLDYLPLLAMFSGPQIRRAIAGRYETRMAESLAATGGTAPLLKALTRIGGLVEAHLFLAPYVGVHGYFGRERQAARRLGETLGLTPERPLRVGVFVDDLDEIHGVATMYANLQEIDGAAHGAEMQMVRCGDPETGADLRAIATLPMPLYAGRGLGVPSLVDVLDLIAERDYDVLHIPTPGPLGLSAMVAGLTLGIPLVGAYHTEFGRYAHVLSGDAMLGDLVEVFVRGFYERCAVVAVPSANTADALRGRGYQIDRLEVLRNGVDTDLFAPARRDPVLHRRLGGGRTLLVYTGRISVEKGLDRLAEHYQVLRARRDDVHLVLVGDGPYREAMANLLGDTATFTGFLRGEVLARTVASGDIFAFPSLTDTLGRAVIEAQACGVPAVVFATGGPRECILPGATGLVAGNDAEFGRLLESLLDDPDKRAEMGAAASAFASDLTWDRVMAGLVALCREVAGRTVAPVADPLAAVVPAFV
ncbi:MAG: glycosyltransferase [Chloroflexia bacterium]|nr:glycosyltransferase [Chloroflexia bacterium]